MTTTPTATKLLCPECRRENEPERIYCHHCGTRLDRSAVRFKKEPIDDTRKRVRQMFDPQRARIRAYFFAVSKMILGAGALAVALDIVLPPDVPPPVKNQVLVSALRFDLEGMASKHQPLQKQISEDEANAFMTAALRSKQPSLDKPLLPFKRACLAFHEKQCSLTAERSLLGFWSVYITCVYSPELSSGRLSGKIVAGRIGRLPVHPNLAQFMGTLFSDVLSALDRDTKLVSSLGSIDFHEKVVSLSAVTP